MGRHCTLGTSLCLWSESTTESVKQWRCAEYWKCRYCIVRNNCVQFSSVQKLVSARHRIQNSTKNKV